VDVHGLLESMIVQRQCALVGAEDVVRMSDASESTGSIDVVSMAVIVEELQTPRFLTWSQMLKILRIKRRVT
jgi:hypothetical protein